MKNDLKYLMLFVMFSKEINGVIDFIHIQAKTKHDEKIELNLDLSLKYILVF